MFRSHVLLLSVLAFGPAIAQESVSSGSDKDLKALIQTVEGPEASIDVRFTPENEAQRVLSLAIHKFYSAMVKNDLIQVYELTNAAYRENMSLQKYLSKNRLSLNQAVIEEVQIKDETCALATGYQMGKDTSGKMGDKLKIPIHQIFVFEEGAWRAYKNPFSNTMGFRLPKSKNYPEPCKF